MKKYALGEILSMIKKNGSFNQKELAQLVGLTTQQVRHRLDFYRKQQEEKGDVEETPQTGFYDPKKEFRMPDPNYTNNNDEDT